MEPANRDTEGTDTVPKTPSTTKKPYEHNLVRTDSKVRKITSMLTPATPHTPTAPSQADTTVLDEGLQYETTSREPHSISFTSVKNLRASVRNTMHNTLTETIASHTYVGLVDERRRIAAIQSGVKLYLIDYGMFCTEFFYQIGLTDFANFGVIKLSPAPKLIDLLRIAADTERNQANTSSQESADEANEIFTNAPDLVAETLIDRREMLNEYFSLDISPDGDLLSIPLLLKGYLPSLGKLPRFLLRLGPYVDWTSEEECFRTFLRELAAFYTPEQLPPPPPPKPQNSNEAEAEAEGEAEVEVEDEFITQRRAQIARMLEHVVFPALRARMVATTRLLRGVVEVADLKGLYRVFERC
ncbi:DNA mismatch repair protein [Aspergillus brasiliensis]|nr:DNA mismatch repair protein [Aspergillus brasiliensis]